MLKPLCLVDLDDTLFQTPRKMVGVLAAEPVRVASLDRQQQPLSLMSQEQVAFFDWLSHSTELVPVTARDTSELSRVTLAFESWKVCTHGAVILQPSGQIEPYWQTRCHRVLEPYQAKLQQRHTALQQAIERAGVAAKLRLIRNDQGQIIYITAKHRVAEHIDKLSAVFDTLEHEHGLDGFYRHQNSNNIAWLPQPIDKGQAVAYLLSQLRTQEQHRPVFGWGDSHSDHHFLQHCSWFGMPRQSQLANTLSQVLTQTQAQTQAQTTSSAP